MKKFVSLFLAVILVVCCFTVVLAADKQYIYVSVAGADENPGTFAKPVASLSKACELAKGGNAVISIMGGTYRVEKTADLGNAKNVTIKNYNDERVTLTGASAIDTALFKKVTDADILKRIVDKKAKENLVSVNMTEAGVTELGAVSMCGFSYPAVPAAPQFVVNGEMQTLARYPDNDYLMIDELVKGDAVRYCNMEGGVMAYKEHAFSFRVNDNRLSKWKLADDLFIFGYFIHDWADATLACSIDFENKNLVSTEYPSAYGVVANRRFYFFNLLEEISKPGEWYLDRKTATLYTYPSVEFKGDTTVDFVYYTDTFLTMDGSENIAIDGIDFSYGLGSAIVAQNTKKLKITNCDFNNITKTVIDITKSFESEVSRCNFTEIGASGVYLENGVEDTLEKGNGIITNCVFDGFQRITPTGTPGINLRGVGNVASHNVLKDGANIAIWFGGNDHIIEYNDISNVCTDTADAGAIYAGRHWEDRGHEIRYNYIHDMGIIDTTTGMKVQAIYLDDGFSSAKVYGNIIENVPSTALYGGGRYNTFENNIVIGGKEPFVFDDRYANGGDSSSITSYLKKTPIDSEPWKTAYPELAGIWDDEPEVPKYNTIKNNVSVNAPGYNIAGLVKEHAIEIQPDLEANTDIFVDYRGGDLTLKEDCIVFEKLSGFKPIDFKAIGLEENTVEATKSAEDVLTRSIILKLNTPVTYVYGNKTQVDPENNAVMPRIINNRTLVPVRFIAESLGGEVSWDDATKKVGITLGGKTIELKLGDTNLTVNGKATTLDVPAQSVEGRTMLPLRAVTESLGMKVFWDNRGLIVVSKAEVITAEETVTITEILSEFN